VWRRLARDRICNKCSSSPLQPSFFLTLILIITVNIMRCDYNKYTVWLQEDNTIFSNQYSLCTDREEETVLSCFLQTLFISFSCYGLLQNLVFQYPLSNMQNKYADRNLCLASYVNTKCSLIGNKQHRYSPFECNVLNRKFGTKRENAGKWIKLQVKNLVNFSLNRYYLVDWDRTACAEGVFFMGGMRTAFKVSLLLHRAFLRFTNY
jgi:hypothetical protein